MSVSGYHCADLCQVVLHPTVLSIRCRAEEGQSQAKASVEGPQCGSIVGRCSQSPHIQGGPSNASIRNAAGDQRSAALVQQLGIGFSQSTVGPADGKENMARVNH